MEITHLNIALNSRKPSRIFYLLALIFSVLAAASFYYLSSQEKPYYTVLVGSYSSAEAAEVEIQELRGHYPTAEIEPLLIKRDDSGYNIWAGKFDQRSFADGMGQKILESGRFEQVVISTAYVENGRVVQVFKEDAPPLEILKADSLSDAPEPTEDNLPEYSAEIASLNYAVAGEDEEEENELAVVDEKNEPKAAKSEMIAKTEIRQDATLGKSGSEREFYTVQVLSSNNLSLASIEYDRIVSRFQVSDLDNLRIELVQGYSTIRVGKFDSRSEAEHLKKIFHEKNYKQALVLSAYILPSRIQQSFSSPVPINNKKTAVSKTIENEADMGSEIAVNPPVAGAVNIVEPTVISVPKEVEGLKAEKAAEESRAEHSTPEDDNITSKTAGTAAEDKDSPKEVSYSFEVVTVLNRDDMGDNLQMPSALFFDDVSDELYLVNSSNNRIVVYGPDYFGQNSIGKGQGLYAPLGGAVGKNGTIYVTQGETPSAPSRLTILNSAFLVVKEISLENIPESEGFVFQKVAAAKSGSLYLTGLRSDKVLVLDTDGNFKKWFSVPVDKKGDHVSGGDNGNSEEKAYLKDVITDSLGNLFFLSEDSSRVYVYSQDEKYLFSFGTKGGASGKLSRPRGIAIDEKKRCFYIVDYMRHTILMYDFTGTFIFEFGGRGYGPEWFNYPVDVEVGGQGHLIVADFFNKRAQVFNISVNVPLPERPTELWTAGIDGK